MIIKTTAIGLTLIATWLTIALAVMLTGKITTAAVSIGTDLPENVAIIGKTKRLLIIRSDDPDFVRNLYNSGATFVLPARQKTCINWQT